MKGAMRPRPIAPIRPPGWLVKGAAEVGGMSVALVRSGVWRSARPSHLVPIERALRQWGQSMAALGVIAAIRYPDQLTVIDERGTITYRELDQRCSRQASALYTQYGIVAGSKVAVLCRNHRWFLQATLAASRLGADVLFVNTEFAPPQLNAVLEQHRPDLLIHDQEFTDALPDDLPTVLAWVDGPSETASLDDLAAARQNAEAEPPKPDKPGHITILTSGTTGAPKAAPRKPTAHALAGLTVSALNRIGLRSGEPMVICPPLFHGLGLLNSMLALFLGSPLVLSRRYDAAEVLAAVDRNRVGSIVAVPVMLQRMLDLGLARDGRARPEVSPCGHLRRLGVGPGVGGAVHRAVRAGALRRVRVERDRDRDDRHLRGPSRSTGHRRPTLPREFGADPRRRRPTGARR